MEANVSLVITVIIFVLLIVILPVYNIFTRQDDMSYNLILKSVTNFADKVRATGILNNDMYQDMLVEIGATQNTFNVEMEIHKSKIINLENGTHKQEYLIEYTDDILKNLENGTVYNLEKGEKFFVRVNNTNITKADSFLANIKIMETKNKIDIDYGGTILVSGIKK